MTRTIDDENSQKELLKSQEVAVTVGDASETLRPNALHVRGVDNLSTADIEAFVNFYINYTYENDTYTQQDTPVWFRVQWVDDTSANLVFRTHSDAAGALQKLALEFTPVENTPTEESPFSPEYLAAVVTERTAQPYEPTIAFHKHLEHLKSVAEDDLFLEKRAQKVDAAEKMDEDGSAVVLHIRQAFESDRKLKNASAYSRYYLLHGEPDRTRPPRRRNERGRGAYTRKDTEDEDLFAEKLGKQPRRDEDDLFADRMRERSPGR